MILQAGHVVEVAVAALGVEIVGRCCFWDDHHRRRHDHGHGRDLGKSNLQNFHCGDLPIVETGLDRPLCFGWRFSFRVPRPRRRMRKFGSFCRLVPSRGHGRTRRQQLSAEIIEIITFA